MKYMKKLAAVLLAAVMAMSLLTACGGGGGASAGNSKNFQDAFGFTGQELTDAINNDLKSNAEYDPNLGPRFADAMNAAIAVAGNMEDPDAASEMADQIMKAAGFDDCKGGTAVVKQGAEIATVASALESSFTKNKVGSIEGRKIGYAAGELRDAPGYYLIFAVVQDK